MPAAPPFMALFFMGAATTMTLLACFSSHIRGISFLDISQDDKTTKFGPFGCSGEVQLSQIGFNFPFIETTHPKVMYGLTKALILLPICCGFSALAFGLGVTATRHRRTPYFTIGMAFTSTLSALATLIVWVIIMIVFGIARDDYRQAGITSEYGTGTWIVFGAFFALALGSISAGFIAIRSYRITRKVYH